MSTLHKLIMPKLHTDAIAKMRTEDEKINAAAAVMIEKPIDMIRAILLKHELAVIEVMRELHESREAAVRAEREACAKVLDDMAEQMVADMEPGPAIEWVRNRAEFIRARGNL